MKREEAATARPARIKVQLGLSVGRDQLPERKLGGPSVRSFGVPLEDTKGPETMLVRRI
jgi:hypothetical protein